MDIIRQSWTKPVRNPEIKAEDVEIRPLVVEDGASYIGEWKIGTNLPHGMGIH